MSNQKYQVSVPIEEFEKWTTYGWSPARIKPSDYPYNLRNIPSAKIIGMWSSGMVGDPRATQSPNYMYPNAVGGIDVVRFDQADAMLGYPYNRDHYICIQSTATPGMVDIFGPYSKDEPNHWLSDASHYFQTLITAPDHLDTSDKKPKKET